VLICSCARLWLLRIDIFDWLIILLLLHFFYSNQYIRDFVAGVYSRVAKHHPTIHPVTLQARTKLFTKYELALKVRVCVGGAYNERAG